MEKQRMANSYPSLQSKDIWKNVPDAVYRHYRHVCSQLQRYNNMRNQLDRFLNVIPVVGFNSAHFDLNLIRQYLFPLIVESDNKKPLFIKKGGNYMAMQTDRLCFMDITYYLAPGKMVMSRGKIIFLICYIYVSYHSQNFV